MNTEHENAVENVAENSAENAAKAAAPSLATIREGNGYLKVGDVGNSVVTCRKLLNSKGIPATQQVQLTMQPCVMLLKNFRQLWDLQVMAHLDKQP